jgi:hypothetical protein
MCITKAHVIAHKTQHDNASKSRQRRKGKIGISSPPKRLNPASQARREGERTLNPSKITVEIPVSDTSYASRPSVCHGRQTCLTLCTLNVRCVTDAIQKGPEPRYHATDALSRKATTRATQDNLVNVNARERIVILIPTVE